MKTICDYCGNFYEDSEVQCPNCSAPNKNIKAPIDTTPTTIDELKQWYADRHLPDEKVTRFFIGKDYKGKKAYGIFKQSNGDFVVYKNKADGTRAIRYTGKDEAYAVNEIYLKLKERMGDQLQRKKDMLKQSNNKESKLYPAEKLDRSFQNADGFYNPKFRFGLFTFVVTIIIFVVSTLLVFAPGIRFYSGNSSGSSSDYSSSDYIDRSPGFYIDWDSVNTSSFHSSSWDSDWDSSWSSSDSWDSDWGGRLGFRLVIKK